MALHHLDCARCKSIEILFAYMAIMKECVRTIMRNLWQNGVKYLFACIYGYNCGNDFFSDFRN